MTDKDQMAEKACDKYHYSCDCEACKKDQRADKAANDHAHKTWPHLAHKNYRKMDCYNDYRCGYIDGHAAGAKHKEEEMEARIAALEKVANEARKITHRSEALFRAIQELDAQDSQKGGSGG